MRLELRNIGIFAEKILDIPDNVKLILIQEPSATGKTIIARTLYSFLTGSIDKMLLKHGRGEGTAKLVLDGKEYKLIISSKHSSVDKVIDEPYNRYLVLTEQSPLYKIYAVPPREIDVESLAKEFVGYPSEMIQLENRLKQLFPEAFDIDSVIEAYTQEIERRRHKIGELKKKLVEIEEKLKELIPVEKADIVLRKRELEKRVEELRKAINEAKNRYARLLAEIQSANYDELKQQRKKLTEEIDRLHREISMLEDAREGYKKIKEGLMKLQGILDILYDLDIPLFGQIVASDTIDMFISDCDSAIQVLSSKYVELRNRVSVLENRKSDIDTVIQEYVRKHREVDQLEVEIKKMQRNLRELEYRLSSMKRKAEEVLAELGLSEEELVKRVMEQGGISSLVREKERIRREIDKLEYEITSFQRALENAERQRREILEKKREYDELKKKYSELKNEFTRKKEKFKKVFRESFREVFRNITIPDFDPEEMKLIRSPYTYAQSERLMLAIAYQYSLIKSLMALGYNIPLVVIDLIVPLDSRWKNEVIRLYRELGVRTILLETSDMSAIITKS